jgi:transcriptional regulator with XRE-family HTH domain
VKKTLADRLAFLISSLGIKQLDFARRIKFAQSYVSMVLSGDKTAPGHRFLEAVCREFSVNPEWLKTGKGEIYTIPGLPLSAEKADVLAKFQLLPPEKQQAIEDIIDAFLLKTINDEEKAAKSKRKAKRK